MKELIQGEKIWIDNHYEGIPLSWDSQDIHLHKITTTKINGKQCEITARISLNNERGVIFDIPKRQKDIQSERTYAKMKKEIQDAFEAPKNQKRCHYFLTSLIECITSINNGKTFNENKTIISDAFNRIMICFDLSEKAGKIMINAANGYFQKYYNDGKAYYIFADKKITEIGELTKEEKEAYRQKGFRLPD